MKATKTTGDVYRNLRHLMVERQLLARGIEDVRVLESMRQVPRHNFVLESLQNEAYNDSPLPIGEGQTISQPFIVAAMAEAAFIKETDKVLEIGTGCGYSAAVLSNLAETVYTVETIPSLASSAKQRLSSLNNVFAFTSDGSMGLAEHAPFDVIIVTAGAPRVPKTLMEQLSQEGRMVIPVRNSFGYENLLRVTKMQDGSFVEENLMEVRFVPLVGEQGWQTDVHAW